MSMFSKHSSKPPSCAERQLANECERNHRSSPTYTANRVFEWVQVHHHKVDSLNAIVAHLPIMFRIVALPQQTTVNLLKSDALRKPGTVQSAAQRSVPVPLGAAS